MLARYIEMSSNEMLLYSYTSIDLEKQLNVEDTLYAFLTYIGLDPCNLLHMSVAIHK